MPGEHGGVASRSGALLSPLRIPAFRRLWAADVISLLGDWAGRLALTVLVLQRTGSPGWAAAVTAVSLAGFVGFGQILATLADRHGRVAVMLVADISRACLFGLMLLSLPIAVILVLAFLAGLATPPFEAARSAAIPDLVPEERYPAALALAGVSVQASLVVGYALGGALLTVVSPRTAIGINALSFLVSAVIVLGLRGTPAAAAASVRSSVTQSLGEGLSVLLRDRMARRSLAIVAITGALGTVHEALVVPYGDSVGFSAGLLGLLAAAVPVGTLVATMIISNGRRDHHSLLRTAALCGLVAASLAAPLFWVEVDGALAFVAFALAGGMFAASIPTNAVIGVRLPRDTRASAMGIAVGVLMGSQALGAAVGGAVAAAFGPAPAITGALALTSIYCGWAVVTTPYDAKHLRRPSSQPPTPDTIVDLVALEAEERERAYEAPRVASM